MKIRVAHIVNPTFGSVFSGHTHYLFSLLSGWKEKGITLDLFGTNVKPSNMNSGDRNYQLPADSLWSIPQEQGRRARIRWSFELLKILIKRRGEYDVVHFHAQNWGSVLSPLLLHFLGKKVVFTMSLFGNDNPGYIRQQPRGKLMVALLRLFDGSIGLSPALINDALKNGFKNVICLPNFMAFPHLEAGIDDTAMQAIQTETRTKLSIQQGSQVLLFIGSIIYRKGVDILIDSFIELSKKYPRLILVLVGPQNKQETSSIDENYVILQKERIQQADVEGRVFWAGIVKEQSMLVNYYQAADIFVFPTRNEGSPNVLVEAMAAKLPVVASLLPGITDEVVSDGESGYLLETDCVSAFTQAIDQLLQNSPKRHDMGLAGRRIALEKFGFDPYCRQLKKFYLDLFEEQPNLGNN